MGVSIDLMLEEGRTKHQFDVHPTTIPLPNSPPPLANDFNNPLDSPDWILLTLSLLKRIMTDQPHLQQPTTSDESSPSDPTSTMSQNALAFESVVLDHARKLYVEEGGR